MKFLIFTGLHLFVRSGDFASAKNGRLTVRALLVVDKKKKESDEKAKKNKANKMALSFVIALNTNLCIYCYENYIFIRSLIKFG